LFFGCHPAHHHDAFYQVTGNRMKKMVHFAIPVSAIEIGERKIRNSLKRQLKQTYFLTLSLYFIDPRKTLSQPVPITIGMR